MKNIMNPDHPMWSDFVSCMTSPAECGHLEEKELICHGDTRRTQTLPGIYTDTDVEGSLDYFKFWDADCDCGVHDKVCLCLGPNFKELERLRLPRPRIWSFFKDLLELRVKKNKKLCV